jgi:predicted dehydrogenase/threonine dehydrogenase-like Zn-dependent dehydrogenase
MRQILVNRGRISLENVPVPLVEPGHVLVEVAYSLISAGTETTGVAQSGKSLIQRALEKPERIQKVIEHLKSQGIQKTVAVVRGLQDQSTPTGYSCSGIVIQVGAGITDLKIGDHVACAGAGYANHAEIVLAPRNLVVKVPDRCDLRDAASMTLGSIAMQGVRRADLRLGEIVAVIGLGLVGQLTVQLLQAAGCRVIGIDLDSRRVELARQLGPEGAFTSDTADIIKEVYHRTASHGVDATIITAASSSNAIVQQAMEITRKKGRVVLVGDVGLSLNRSPFYEKEIDFLISSSYGPGRYDSHYEEKGIEYPYAYVRWTENRNMQEYLRLVNEGKVKLGSILEREYELAQAAQAYEELSTAPEKPLGVLLRYPIADEDLRRKKLETQVVLRNASIEGKIRIAIIGAGAFAKSIHLPNLQKLSHLYHIRAIVSGTGSNAKETAQQIGADYASTNYQDVLDDPDVDAVLICTRHHLHAQQAIQAAQAGKAIFLEKPMALNQEELERLVDVLHETKVPFMVGYNRRFSPAAQQIKDLVAGRQSPLMILYRMNAGYLPPDHWTQTAEGGGRIIGEACHIFDLFQYLIESPVLEVSATPIVPQSEHILASDNMSVTLRYDDGSVATLVYTALGSTDFSKEYMEVYTDGKVITVDDYRELRLSSFPAKSWSFNVQQKGHLDELEMFSKFVRRRQPSRVSVHDLVETANITFVVAGIR